MPLESRPTWITTAKFHSLRFDPYAEDGVIKNVRCLSWFDAHTLMLVNNDEEGDCKFPVGEEPSSSQNADT